MKDILIPLIILLLSAGISVFIIINYNKKKNNKPKRHEYADNIDINMSNSILPQVPTNEQPVQVVQEEVKQEEVAPPTIDIPIPSVDDTPITIEEPKQLENENTSEAIVVEHTTPIVENNINQDEIVHVQIAHELTNEVDDSVKIDEPKPLMNDVGETVQVEIEKPITNDIGETAFNSMPINNTTINTDIKVDNHEYVSERTEMFNLEDIKNEMKRIEEERSNQL